ncbi:39S ribosomal protein L34, mitochondrial isoform X2 [Monodelphis domestica]|uniref:39S ribosomal protein L34, mitochondrial isoform X2 n=1 Tax=Monodelphis domestica TaxID=13616 RepID=UPI0024E2298D|nr:39S ribosomal protein L34, mitochondrial isoform X2 [Monodelphis domestica]
MGDDSVPGFREVNIEAERREDGLRAANPWPVAGPYCTPGSFLSWLPQLRTLTVFTRVSADPPGSFHAPWSYQQVRPKARGNEYQPSNIKRKRKHGWIRRLSTPGGIQVILRRMLKGRKSLSH